MVIKEVEHQDVYKKKHNLIQYSRTYKKLGNEILDFYKQRLNEKYDYLDRIKNNNSKLLFLKELKRVKKHDKMRLKKIKITEPFPLFLTKIKKSKKVKFYKQLKIALNLKLKKKVFNFNRIFYVHKIYQKLKKKYYYYNNKLKKLKKKSKNNFKLKIHL